MISDSIRATHKRNGYSQHPGMKYKPRAKMSDLSVIAELLR